jgi:hypothetical protein
MDFKACTNLMLNIRNAIATYYMEKLPMESLLKIPEGYNNNMIWNIGHMISVGYSLNFSIAGLIPPADIEMIKKFKRGSFPLEYTDADIQWINEHLIRSVQEIENLWAKNKVSVIVTSVTTELGNVISSPSDALAMTLVHDMLHFERIRLFRKLTKTA